MQRVFGTIEQELLLSRSFEWASLLEIQRGSSDLYCSSVHELVVLLYAKKCSIFVIHNMQSLIASTFSSAADATEMTLLYAEFEELENRNKELEQRCSYLQDQLAQERKTLIDVTHNVQFDMDRMKKTISELESLLGLLLQCSTNESDTTASCIEALLSKERIDRSYQDSEPKQHSEIELLRILCKIWKDKYTTLKIQHCCKENGARTSQNVQEQQVPVQFLSSSPRSSTKNLSYLKNSARGRSMPPKRNKAIPLRDKSIPPRNIREPQVFHSNSVSAFEVQHDYNGNDPQRNAVITSKNVQEQISVPFLRSTRRNPDKSIASLKNLVRGRSMPPKKNKVIPLRDKSTPPRNVREIPVTFSDSVSVTEL